MHLMGKNLVDSLLLSGYESTATLGSSHKPKNNQDKGCTSVYCGSDVGHRGGNAEARVTLSSV